MARELAFDTALPDRRTLTDQVYDAVREMVADQHISPGSRINIEDFARRLHVSPTPVREALARLDADQLVRREPMRGYTVIAALDEEGFACLFDMRLLLEPYAASLAAAHATAQHGGDLERALAGMRKVGKRPSEGQYRVYAAQDARFHQVLAVASGNRFLREAIERLQVHPRMVQLYFRHRRVITPEAADEHEAILRAVRGRDREGADLAMREHIIGASQRVQQDLAESGPGERPATA